jgi:hypothetical protein
VLLLQHCTHPHVILPASWAPVRYNYHRVEVRGMQTVEAVCWAWG